MDQWRGEYTDDGFNDRIRLDVFGVILEAFDKKKSTQTYSQPLLEQVAVLLLGHAELVHA